MIRTGIFVFLLLIISTSSLSQERCIIFQNELLQPVPYVSLSLKSGEVIISDSAGKLCLNSLSFTNDSVLITALGYEKKKASVSNLVETVVLKQQIIVLPEVVVVNGNGRSEIWGTKENPGILGYKCGLTFKNPDQSIGRIIFPEGEYKKAAIEAVSFFDGTGKGMATPVRLRIFLLGKDSLPVADYLLTNLIVNTNGKGWLTIDLKRHELVMLKEGLVFVLELFDFGKQFFYKEQLRGRDADGNKFKKEQKKYGFSVAMTNSDATAITLHKFNNRSGWVKRNSDSIAFSNCESLVCKVNVRVWR